MTVADGGRRIELALAGSRPIVLYVFAPSCSWCVRNHDNITALAAQRSAEYRFVGIAQHTDGRALAAYLEKYRLPFEVHRIGEDTARTLALATPTTLTISPEGKIIQGWGGAYVGDKVEQVERFFGVRLPGLRATGESDAELSPVSINSLTPRK